MIERHAPPGGLALRDVHAPAKMIEGEVHWQMAAGPEAVDVVISATALHALGPAPLPAYLEVFEANREFLCEVARAKAARTEWHNRIRIEPQDLL